MKQSEGELAQLYAKLQKVPLALLELSETAVDMFDDADKGISNSSKLRLRPTASPSQRLRPIKNPFFMTSKQLLDISANWIL